MLVIDDDPQVVVSLDLQLLSGADEQRLAAVADRIGARWLRKPVDPQQLARVVGGASPHRELDPSS
ncbi:MAG: hypothetical protein WEB03_16370 [Nitriliruptor sp.]|uniref:hypothetical protein n=1 Tax=Nitriliruptor sp. TaxID=2448056 RepID=UPI0034A05EEA